MVIVNKTNCYSVKDFLPLSVQLIWVEQNFSQI